MTARTVLTTRSSAGDVADVLDVLDAGWRDQGAAPASDIRLESVEEQSFTTAPDGPFSYPATSEIVIAVLAFRVEGSRKPSRRLAVAQTIIGGMASDGYALVCQAKLGAPVPPEAVPGIAWMLSTGQLQPAKVRAFEL